MHFMSIDLTASLRDHLGALPRFALVAGLGWLVDLAILMALAGWAGLPAGWANVVSSLSAACLVYLVSHYRIHDGRPDAVSLRLGAYLLYTTLLVLGASFVLQFLVRAMSEYITPAQALVTAKVLVTPPQLLANFLVSRHLARKARL